MGGFFLMKGGFLFFKRKSIMKLNSGIKDLNDRKSVTSITPTNVIIN